MRSRRSNGFRSRVRRRPRRSAPCAQCLSFRCDPGLRAFVCLRQPSHFLLRGQEKVTKELESRGAPHSIQNVVLRCFFGHFQRELLVVLRHEKHPRDWTVVQLLGCSSFAGGVLERVCVLRPHDCRCPRRRSLTKPPINSTPKPNMPSAAGSGTAATSVKLWSAPVPHVHLYVPGVTPRLAKFALK